MSNAPIYLHLATLTAPKTSLNAQGEIVYAILKDEASTEVFFTLLENQGGSGYFGREIIPFANIEACLNGVDLKQTIPAKRFLKAFTASRSVNNGGFLCACLRHQGLLKPAPESPQQHVIGDDWAAWKAKMLETQSDKVYITPDAEKPAKAEPASSKASDKKEKKQAKAKKEVAIPVGTEGDGNVDPA
ncbi:hypothetical protein [Zoogloea sp.]|uniref:hypothetical protein n=1 Tax=Zoogloea sp. TaxID=49181 RepID=UPI0035B38785